MFVIIIPVDQRMPIAIDDFPAQSSETLGWLRTQVGGPIERVSLPGGRVMWINEEGKDVLPRNATATALAIGHRAVFPADFIAGPAVITGHDGPETVALTVGQARRTLAELHAAMAVTRG
jgi:Domain of unknown function (DUF3846)